MRRYLSFLSLLVAAPLLATVPAIPSFKDVAKQIRPSVVNISIVKNIKAISPFAGRHDPFLDQFFGRFFDEMPHDQVFRQRSLGSGIIIDAVAGYVLTNNHVVEDADAITVKLYDKREVDAKVVGRDAKTDLAVIKLKSARDLTAAAFGDSDAIDVGDWVLAVGSPFGLEQTVSHGIISAKGRVIGAGPYDDFLQTDAPINPGNSGGPLVDLSGQVVGINSAITSKSGGNEGVGFAIPSNLARKIYHDLVSSGKVTRGWLGISIQDLDGPLSKHFGLEAGAKGVLVADVMEEGPARKAGLKAGDIIQDFDGHKVEAVHELQRQVAESGVGKTVAIKVWRAKAAKSLNITIGDLSAFEGEAKAEGPKEPAKAPRLGLQVRALSVDEAQDRHLDKGVVVEQVAPGSPADQGGIQVGDVILELDKSRISSPDELARLTQRLQAGEAVIVRVQRGPRSLYLTVQLSEDGKE